MTLRENFSLILMEFWSSDWESKCEEIADELAIGFALWKEANVLQDENGMYYSESRIQVSRNNPVDINQLMIIYKKEKGL
jgi:hypothetical protein